MTPMPHGAGSHPFLPAPPEERETAADRWGRVPRRARERETRDAVPCARAVEAPSPERARDIVIIDERNRLGCSKPLGSGLAAEPFSTGNRQRRGCRGIVTSLGSTRLRRSGFLGNAHMGGAAVPMANGPARRRNVAPLCPRTTPVRSPVARGTREPGSVVDLACDRSRTRTRHPETMASRGGRIGRGSLRFARRAPSDRPAHSLTRPFPLT
jgi:hypothetical protein